MPAGVAVTVHFGWLSSAHVVAGLMRTTVARELNGFVAFMIKDSGRALCSVAQ